MIPTSASCLHYVGWGHLCRVREHGGAGLLNIKCWAEALLRRQAFRISASQNFLWSSSVRFRYAFSSWYENSICHSSSRILKRLVKAGRTIEDGLSTVVDEDSGVPVTVWGEAHLIAPRVKDFYSPEDELDSFNFRHEYSRIWKSKCSPSMKTFQRKVCIGKLPVRALLSRWSAIPGDCARCPGVLETLDHALFNCTSASAIWAIIKDKWNTIVWPSSTDGFLDDMAAAWYLPSLVTHIYLCPLGSKR